MDCSPLVILPTNINADEDIRLRPRACNAFRILQVTEHILSVDENGISHTISINRHTTVKHQSIIHANLKRLKTLRKEKQLFVRQTLTRRRKLLRNAQTPYYENGNHLLSAHRLLRGDRAILSLGNDSINETAPPTPSYNCTRTSKKKLMTL